MVISAQPEISLEHLREDGDYDTVTIIVIVPYQRRGHQGLKDHYWFTWQNEKVKGDECVIVLVEAFLQQAVAVR